MLQVEISFNKDKNGIELLFNEKLTAEVSGHLKELGFKDTFKQPLKWYAPQHPAYVKFAHDLKEALLKGAPFDSVLIAPSYTASEENIDHNKFSYVTISFLKDEAEEQESYVLFDSYKKVAAEIATRYGKDKYGNAFKEVDIYPRSYKRKARALLKEEKVITGVKTEAPGDNPLKETKTLSLKEQKALFNNFVAFYKKRQSDFPQVKIDEHELPILFSGWLRTNLPRLTDQKESLWNAYLEFQSEDQVKEAGQSDPNNINTSNLRKQLIGLGFKNLFTAQEALEKSKQVVDFQPRWHDAYEHFAKQYEKPGLKQIEVWQSEIKALKGKRDKDSTAKRKEIKSRIESKIKEIERIKGLLEDENTEFQKGLIDLLIERAKDQGHTFSDEDTITDFSVEVSQGLFDERMIEPYYKQPIPVIADQIIEDFFGSSNKIKGEEDHPNELPLSELINPMTKQSQN